MKERKLRSLCLLLCLALCLSACGAPAPEPSPEPTPAPTPSPTPPRALSSGIVVELLDTMEKLCSWTSDIVKATLLGHEYFDSYNDVWEFRVEEDYTGHAADTIYVYDGWDSGWKDGHTYYLFLECNENALYPHPIYTGAEKKLTLDTDAEQTKLFGISMANLPGEIESMVEQGKVGTKLKPRCGVTDETDLAAVVAQADMILETSLTEERKYNQYAAHYTLREPRVLRGPAGYIDPEKKTQPMFGLPPGLDLTRRYYLFLKRNADNDMWIFSRAYPVLETSEVDEETLLSYR